MAVINADTEQVLERSKSIIMWSFLLFILLFLHMLLDPILHWNG